MLRKIAQRRYRPRRRSRWSSFSSATIVASAGNSIVNVWVKVRLLASTCTGVASLAPKLSTGPKRLKTIHPLLIEHVLINVFRHLFRQEEKFVDLPNVRQVCKTWNQTATTLFRRTRGPLEISNRTSAGIRIAALDRFTETMAKRTSTPAEVFVFHAEFFLSKYEIPVSTFLRNCGTFMTRLTLKIGPGLNLNTITNQVHFENLSLPSLAVFFVHIESRLGPSPPLATLISLLLQAAKNLLTFHFKLRMDSIFLTEDQVRDQSIAYGALREYLPKSLKVLNLDVDIGEEQLNWVPKGDLKLKKFDYEFNGSIDEMAMTQFLETQTESLLTLLLEQKDKDLATPILSLPRLSKLIRLTVHRVEVRVMRWTWCPPLPKLRVFNANSWENEKVFSKFLENSNPTSTLKVISLPVVANCNPELIRMTSETFPGLRSIQIKMVEGEFETFLGLVIEHLPNLEDLVLNCSRKLNCHWDSLLSGIPEEEIAKLEKAMDLNKKIDFSKLNTRPGLVDLKKLRLLRFLGKDCATVMVTLTNFAAEHVLLRMKSLMEVCWHTTQRVERDRPKLKDCFSRDYQIKLRENRIAITHIPYDGF